MHAALVVKQRARQLFTELVDGMYNHPHNKDDARSKVFGRYVNHPR